MARDEGERGFQWPVTGGGMEIGVADATGLGFYDDLPRASGWPNCSTTAACIMGLP